MTRVDDGSDHVTVNTHISYMYMCVSVCSKEPTRVYFAAESRDLYLDKCVILITLLNMC